MPHCGGAIMDRRIRNDGLAKEILDFETREIAQRRHKAGLMDSQDDDDAARKATVHRVGLALSGGGVRSGAFNLGVIQAFDAHGLLREVDYLSTVSGGGYAGSLLSAMGAGPAPADNGDASNAAPAAGKAPRSIVPGGLGRYSDRQPEAVRAVIRGSNYLVRPLSFLNDWFSGWILVNVTVLSLLLAGLASLACVYRMLDYRDVIDFLYALGFQSDVSRAFVPAFVAFVAWAVVWICKLFLNRADTKPVGRGLTNAIFLVMVAFAVIAVAALLGTGDIYVPIWNATADRPEDLAGWLDPIKSMLKLILVLALVVTLAPYLWPKSLIRSGSQPRSSHLERWVFKVASYGLFVGVPLFVFSILAREDISGWNKNRPDFGDITPIHISDGVSWHRFLGRVRAEKAMYDETKPATHEYCFSRDLWNRLDQLLSEDGQTDLREAIIRDASDREQWNNSYGLFGRLLKFTTIWDTQCRLLKDQQKVAEVLNEQFLHDPEFHRHFAVPETATGKTASLLKEAKKAAELAGKNLAPLAPADPNEDAQLAWAQRESRLANYRLCQAYFGKDVIRDPETVFAYVVTRPPSSFFPFFEEGDQAWRLKIFWISAAACLIAGFWVQVNLTSVHGFYRDRLAKVWVGSGRSMTAPQAGPETTIPLTGLGENVIPVPYHLINCTVNSFATSGRTGHPDVPTTARFIFSKGFCGSPALGYAATKEYPYDLANATAVSGAAVSPAVFGNPFVVAILVALNFRLGQWLFNPARRSADEDRLNWLWRRRPPIPLLMDYWLHRDPKGRRYCFVTDGGHYDNLGLESLLERRCRVIIVSDAGADPQGSCDELIKVLGRCAADNDISVVPGTGQGPQLGLADLAPDPDTRLAKRHYIIARVAYPDRLDDAMGSECDVKEGILVYLKASLMGDEGDAELARNKERDSEFPHDPTVDQFYDESQFQAYRRLGYHIAERLCNEIRPPDRCEPLLSEWDPFTAAREQPCAEEAAVRNPPCDVLFQACPFRPENGNGGKPPKKKRSPGAGAPAPGITNRSAT